MNRYRKGPAIALATLGAIACYQTPARADDTADEIRALKAQLKELEEKVDAQARKQKETQVQIRAVESHPRLRRRPSHIRPGSALGRSAARRRPASPPPNRRCGACPLRDRQVFISMASASRPAASSHSKAYSGTASSAADIATPYQNIPYYNARTGATERVPPQRPPEPGQRARQGRRRSGHASCGLHRGRLPRRRANGQLEREQLLHSRASGTFTRPSIRMTGARMCSPARPGP